jgi:transposase InsO family protein
VKRELVEKDHRELSVWRQCEILTCNRSSLYYELSGLREEDQRILDEMDRIYLDFPYYGSRRMSRELKRRGYEVGRHEARHLMRILGVEAIYPRKRLSIPDQEHQIYPYFLRNVAIDRPDIAWAADITYIRLKHGFVYLVAVMDLYSRYIVRTLKYEEVYTKSYESAADCKRSLREYIDRYNRERLHQSLKEYDTPFEAYRQMKMAVAC